jgi:TolB-like protein
VAAVRDSAEVAAPAARTMTRLIALPFRVLRPDPETDFLAFSLPDAITMSLTGRRNLLVRSSAAAALFDPQAPDLRRLAADADVDVALMGTILRAGSQLRATAQLVEAPAGTVVWSHSSQHPLQDVFALQDELVGGIVSSLSQSLGGPDSGACKCDVPRNPAAYELFLRGNELGRVWERLADARDLYLRSLELDPEFAPAWASLGRCHRVLAKYYDVPGAAVEAERAFQRALELNPDLPLLHRYYAQLECDEGRASEAMRRLLRRAQKTVDPEYFAGLVHACRYAGLLEASVAAHEEARRLDPNIQTSVLNTYGLLGDFERMVREAPPGESDMKALALFRLGRKEEALAAWRAQPIGDAPMVKAWDEMIVAVLTEAPTARALTEQLAMSPGWRDPEGYMMSALFLSLLGSDGHALRKVRDAIDGGFYPVHFLLRDAWLARLRGDPGFAELVRIAELRRGEALAVFRAEGGERLLGLRAAG